MILLDASVVISLLSSADGHHERAVAIVEEGAEQGFLLHALTLAEILVGPARVGRVHQLLGQLESMGVEQFEQPADETVFLAEVRATSGLKMPDCCVLSVALRTGWPLATFDDRLAAAARERGLVVVQQ